jgi:hypothetical protein
MTATGSTTGGTTAVGVTGAGSTNGAAGGSTGSMTATGSTNGAAGGSTGSVTATGSMTGVSATGGVTGTGSTSGASAGSTGSVTFVSFSRDLIPIIQQHCALPTVCHMEQSNSMPTALGGQRPYLGPLSGTVPPATIATILQGIVGRTSYEATHMLIVKAGDPNDSYLMHKLDNTLMGIDCSAGDLIGQCGVYMPNSELTILPLRTRDLFRTWIAEGAPNN